jgi:hypothetical protein
MNSIPLFYTGEILEGNLLEIDTHIGRSAACVLETSRRTLKKSNLRIENGLLLIYRVISNKLRWADAS